MEKTEKMRVLRREWLKTVQDQVVLVTRRIHCVRIRNRHWNIVNNCVILTLPLIEPTVQHVSVNVEEKYKLSQPP